MVIPSLFRQFTFRVFLAGFMFVACFLMGPAYGQSEAPRTVVIGDVHGDFKQFVKLLSDAKVIDRRKRWIAGATKLVQLGDVTDRGPDSLKAVRLLQALKDQASDSGGQVDVLIGNHEMMNVIGDLRYVHPGEYKAFRDSNSKQRQNNYYQQTKQHELALAKEKGETVVFDKAHRKAFNKKFPLGYVEHRLAWQADGELGKWVLANPAVLVKDGVVYAHGGLSHAYIDKSIHEINTRVRTNLIDPIPKQGETLTIDDQQGPLWHRGWAQLPETNENHAKLDAVLKTFNAERMVIAHTPLLPTVLPRFDGKVLMVDVGLAAHYGNGTGVLEIINDKAFVRHGDQLIDIPQDSDQVIEYLTTINTAIGGSTRIERYIKGLEAEKLEQPQLLERQQLGN